MTEKEIIDAWAKEYADPKPANKLIYAIKCAAFKAGAYKMLDYLKDRL